MKSNKKELLNRLLEYQFACIELNLYLDCGCNDLFGNVKDNGAFSMQI